MSNRFPLVEVTGSHGKVGQAIGETMREVIRDAVEEHRKRTPDFAAKLEESRG